jgi:hypothetical protein
MFRSFGSRSALSVFAGVVAAGFVVTGALIAQPNDATSLNFTYSQDAEKVVLFVQTIVPLSAVSKSMTLYGDGRLELARGRSLKPSEETHTVRLTNDEVRALLADAITSGVAEWDSLTIRARQLKETAGAQFSGADDAPTVVVMMSLDALQRGEGAEEKRNIRADFRLNDPAYAARFFPEIKEFEGVLSLMQYMEAAFARARGGER